MRQRFRFGTKSKKEEGEARKRPVNEASRKRYGTPRAEVEAALLAKFQYEEGPIQSKEPAKTPVPAIRPQEDLVESKQERSAPTTQPTKPPEPDVQFEKSAIAPSELSKSEPVNLSKTSEVEAPQEEFAPPRKSCKGGHQHTLIHDRIKKSRL